MAKIRNPENAELICQLITQGMTLKQIGQRLGCSAAAIAIWAREDKTFDEMYFRAKEAQMDIMAEEIVEISDDGTNDWQTRELEDGRIETVPDKEHVHRSRLRVDTRKWLMARFRPRRYGDKLAVEHGGADGGPILIATGVIRSGDDEAK